MTTERARVLPAYAVAGDDENLGRAAVAAVGLPLVLGFVWLGGWWLFVLALVAGALALHEFYAMTRPLRPSCSRLRRA